MEDREAWHDAVHGVTECWDTTVTEQQSNHRRPTLLPRVPTFLLSASWTEPGPWLAPRRSPHSRGKLVGVQPLSDSLGIFAASGIMTRKSLMLGKIEGRRRSGHQRMRWLDGITDAMDMSLGKLREMVRGREAWHAGL